MLKKRVSELIRSEGLFKTLSQHGSVEALLAAHDALKKVSLFCQCLCFVCSALLSLHHMLDVASFEKELISLSSICVCNWPSYATPAVYKQGCH